MLSLSIAETPGGLSVPASPELPKATVCFGPIKITEYYWEVYFVGGRIHGGFCCWAGCFDSFLVWTATVVSVATAFGVAFGILRFGCSYRWFAAAVGFVLGWAVTSLIWDSANLGAVVLVVGLTGCSGIVVEWVGCSATPPLLGIACRAG